jgi:preprotein translocase subunit SecE
MKNLLLCNLLDDKRVEMLLWYRQVYEFFSSVRTEIKRVQWPERKENVFNVVIVLLLALVFSVFFFILDHAIMFILRLGLGYGGD